MNLPLDERSRLCRDRSSGPLGGCKLPAVDMCGSQSADTIKMNFRSQAPQLVDLSGLGRLQGRSGRGQTRRNAVEDAWGPNRLSDPPNVRGPSEGVNSWGDRATALIEDIWCEKIRGCSYREGNTVLINPDCGASSPPCPHRVSGQPPEPGGSRRKARGADGESAKFGRAAK
jgi:hypothetical protein